MENDVIVNHGVIRSFRFTRFLPNYIGYSYNSETDPESFEGARHQTSLTLQVSCASKYRDTDVLVMVWPGGGRHSGTAPFL